MRSSYVHGVQLDGAELAHELAKLLIAGSPAVHLGRGLAKPWAAMAMLRASRLES